ncbi:MAG: glycosyltransferase [Clostridia bacterium]|nr:glycosyltransferase [Clostridia bacterium]
MRILLVATRMGIGGAETHVLTLARVLRRRGNHVHILSAGGAYIPALISAQVEHTVLPLDKKDIFSVTKSAKAIWRIATEGRYDIVHAHGRIPQFICGMLSKRGGFPPFAVTAHGFYDPAPPLRAFTLWGRRTIAVSEDVKSFIVEKYKLDPASIDVITNGVDTDVPAHQPSNRLRIVTASRLDGDTALCPTLLCELMPRICKDHAELQPTLTVVGGGEKLPELREAARLANSQSPGAVTMAGSVLDMQAVLARADIFVGSSRAALEAMAAGVPVVLCSDMGCDGVLDETNLRRAEETNFTCRGGAPADLETLRLAVERLICADERERSLYGAFGRAYVTRRASAELFADKTIAFWQDLLASERGGVMLCGYFGACNAGDDATLDAVLESLPELPKGVLPTVPAGKKGALPEGVRRIGRYNVFALARELAKTRLFILCGGTLLQNSTSNRSLGYYYLLSKLASKQGARVMIYAGGIGPVIGDEAAYETVSAVENCDAVTLRDPDSLELLEEMECETDGIAITADAAIATEPLPLPESILKRLPEGREYFAVSVRPLKGLNRGERARAPEEIYETVVSAVRVISDRRNAVPLFIPFAPEDVGLCEKLCRKAERGFVLPRMRAGHIISVIEKCSFTLGMRLHSGVFSSIAGVPAIMIAYDPKVAAFAKRAYHPAPLDPDREDFSMRAIVASAGALYTNMTAARSTLRARTAELRRLTEADKAIVEAIYNAK